MLSSKERILVALSHKEPDRIPIDIGSTIVTGVKHGFYSKLLEFLGCTKRVEMLDYIQQLARLDEEILGKFLIDTRGFLPNIARKNPAIEKEGDCFIFTDEWGVVWNMPRKGVSYFSVLRSPLSSAQTVRDVEKYSWPIPDSSVVASLQDEILAVERDYFVVVESYGSGIFETATRIRGYEQFLIDLVFSPRVAEAILEKVLEVKMHYVDILAGTLSGHFHCLREGDDLASQQNLIISKDMYRRFIMPRHKRLFEYARRRLSSPFYIFFHSCGAVSELIPLFIEAGIDILNPIQFSASGMDSKFLKKSFGSEITFWGGGVDTQHTLPFSNPNGVAEEVKKQIEVLAPGGGFVFAPVHNVQDDVPVENFLAMWETWWRNSKKS